MTHFNPEQFRKARKELSFTQKEFATELRTNQRSVCFWETKRTVPGRNKLIDMAVYFALQFDAHRAHRITGLEIDAIRNMISNDKLTPTQPPIITYQKILIVTYESGVQRWYPVNATTLETIVMEHTFIDDLQIVEQGGEL